MGLNDLIPDFKKVIPLKKMHFRSLDSDFKALSIVEAYDSIIWAERYNDLGDFQLTGIFSEELQELLSSASYLFNNLTMRLMIIEDYEIEYTEEDGVKVTIEGKSFESFLNRRVALAPLTILNPTDRRISQIICNLVSNAFSISDSSDSRHWSLLRVVNETSQNSKLLPVDTALVIEAGENLLTTVKNLCEAASLGFRCELNPTTGLITFYVYEGTDLSIQGPDMVVLSDFYDNLATAKEKVSSGHIKNVVVVAGEAVDVETELPVTEIVELGLPVGLERRETYIKTDQQQVIYYDDGSQGLMLLADYKEALKTTATNALLSKDNRVYRAFDGSILEFSAGYGDDFTLGDILGFWMPHGTPTKTRLSGIVFSDDKKLGPTLVPEFIHDVMGSITVLEISALSGGLFNATWDAFEALTFSGNWVDMYLFCIEDSDFTITMECKFGTIVRPCSLSSSNGVWTLGSGANLDTLTPIVGEWFVLRVGPTTASCGSASVATVSATGTSYFDCFGDGPGGFYLDKLVAESGAVLWDGAIGTNAWTDLGDDPHTFRETTRA